MTNEWNGRFAPYGGSDRENDPDLDFPMQESYTDCAGKEREFEIRYRDFGLGFAVWAEEIGKERMGYEFWAFNDSSPYLALGRLRDKIREALSTRHIEKTKDGLQVYHDTLKGRITASPDVEGPVVVVDGVPIGWDEFGRMILTFEGFRFEMTFVDRGG